MEDGSDIFTYLTRGASWVAVSTAVSCWEQVTVNVDKKPFGSTVYYYVQLIACARVGDGYRLWVGTDLTIQTTEEGVETRFQEIYTRRIESAANPDLTPEDKTTFGSESPGRLGVAGVMGYIAHRSYDEETLCWVSSYDGFEEE
jgi:hypothetical protein